MVLAMVRPWRHENGTYYLRRRVPDDLKAVLGVAEIRRSLNTRDHNEAKRRFAQALIELDAQWANLRRGPQSLSEGQAHALALSYEERHLGDHRENPSAQTFWDTRLSAELWKPAPLTWLDSSKNNVELLTAEIDMTPIRRREMRDWCEKEADLCLRQHGLLVDDAGHHRLARAIGSAMHRASVNLRRLADGEFITQGLTEPPPFSSPSISQIASKRPEKPLRFVDMFEEWAAERRPKEKTRYTFTATLRQLEVFLGHDDARRVTNDDLLRWKLALLEADLHTKTIRDGKLAPIKAIFAVAVQNRRLPINPVNGIQVLQKDEEQKGIQDYTDDEARIILRAARMHPDPLFRWAPWICAYTGARISEVCQLRAQDIGIEDGIDFIQFTKAAGSLKNRPSERIIPMHPAVIKEGLPSFAKTIQDGPIFPHIKPDRFGSRGGTAVDLMNPWIKDLFKGTMEKQPNHAWRHRMVTLTRDHEIIGDIGRALTGHSQKDTHSRYGRVKLRSMQNQIVKMPELEI